MASPGVFVVTLDVPLHVVLAASNLCSMISSSPLWVASGMINASSATSVVLDSALKGDSS